jgi:hypothetical protein
MSLKISKGLTLRKGWQPMDPDAAAYITAVETADGQALEEKTKIAIDNFVLGCKADGIWNAIKASCILAGARTLSGALVPLVGTAPTNFNFVSGDYNRKTGLVGDGSTKYLDSNRNNNADPQNNKHVSVYVSSNSGSAQTYMGGFGTSGSNAGTQMVSNSYWRINQTVNVNGQSNSSATGLIGASRSNGTELNTRTSFTNILFSSNSSAPSDASLWIFARNLTAATNSFSGRLAFYSIGESLDLALLDARVTDLINAFVAAIP